MHARAAQYLNEITSLIFMGLMIVALVVGQAAATPQPAADATNPSAIDEIVREVDFSFRHKGE